MSLIKRIALILILIFALSLPVSAVEILLESDGNAEDIITLTSFADSGEISNISQAETYVSLGLMYHSTGGKFLPEEKLSNAFALRLVFRSAGKEDEANKLAYDKEARRAAGLGKYDDLSWADGYYLLAMKEGMLSKAEFTDAYFNPGSPLARDADVSAQNLIKWLSIAQNVILADHPLPSDVYIDGAYSKYYKALYKHGIFTASDVRYFAPYRQITRNDILLLLEKFENFILNNMKIRFATGEVTGINIKFADNDYVRTISCYASGMYFKIRLTGSNMASPFADISGETAVFGKGQPDISGVLRKGDKVKIYYKDNKVLFIKVTSYNQKEEYKPSPVNFDGTLYLYDPTSKTIAVDCKKDGFNIFYASDSVRVFRGTSEIEKTELSENMTDSVVTIYLDSNFRGGLYRVYSVLTN